MQPFSSMGAATIRDREECMETRAADGCAMIATAPTSISRMTINQNARAALRPPGRFTHLRRAAGTKSILGVKPERSGPLQSAPLADGPPCARRVAHAALLRSRSMASSSAGVTEHPPLTSALARA